MCVSRDRNFVGVIAPRVMEWLLSERYTLPCFFSYLSACVCFVCLFAHAYVITGLGWWVSMYMRVGIYTLHRHVRSSSEFFLRPTDSRPVCLGIRPPFGAHDQIYLSLLFSSDHYFILLSMASSLTRKRVCSLECVHSLVRSLTTNNHTLPSHPRLCSLSVASYDSQGLRWKYSNPPPHGEGQFRFLFST
jgi:hypothetical protein